MSCGFYQLCFYDLGGLFVVRSLFSKGEVVSDRLGVQGVIVIHDRFVFVILGLTVPFCVSFTSVSFS